MITCLATEKKYIGITSRSLQKRWTDHVYGAMNGKRECGIYRVIRKYGPSQFIIECLCVCRSWEDLCATKIALIKQWNTRAPHGYNLSDGGNGPNGVKRSADSVEKSAAKHRGKPCHPNTKRRASEFHKGKPKSAEHRDKIGRTRIGKPRSPETKRKLSEYWAERRARGDFKTTTPYEHHLGHTR